MLLPSLPAPDRPNLFLRARPLMQRLCLAAALGVLAVSPFAPVSVAWAQVQGAGQGHEGAAEGADHGPDAEPGADRPGEDANGPEQPGEDAGGSRRPEDTEEMGPAPDVFSAAAPDTGSGQSRKQGAAAAVSDGPRNAAGAQPDPQTRALPVVVELFTAQGCSSCPPADAMLGALTARQDVLALAWHVDYWDYLGWADAFARPEHTLRQEAYAVAARARGVYTPQFVVDGEETLESLRPAALMAMIGAHAARPPAITVTATRSGAERRIELTPQTRIPGGVTVMLVRYAPRRDVRMAAGENRGETISYYNVVMESQVLAQWPARAPLRLALPAQPASPPGDLRSAIIAQQALPGRVVLPGPILAAMTID